MAADPIQKLPFAVQKVMLAARKEIIDCDRVPECSKEATYQLDIVRRDCYVNMLIVRAIEKKEFWHKKQEPFTTTFILADLGPNGTCTGVMLAAIETANSYLEDFDICYTSDFALGRVHLTFSKRKENKVKRQKLTGKINEAVAIVLDDRESENRRKNAVDDAISFLTELKKIKDD